MSTSQIVAGGVRTPSEQLVATDGHSISGAGVGGDPITQRILTQSDDQILAGMPCFVEGYDTNDVAYVEAAQGNHLLNATFLGLAVAPNAAIGGGFATSLTLQNSGTLELTTAEWDAITSGSGGLLPGPYYVSSTVAGHLTQTAPSAGGTFTALVGFGMSPKVMALAGPGLPKAN
jgi:hypothetical protein